MCFKRKLLLILLYIWNIYLYWLVNSCSVCVCSKDGQINVQLKYCKYNFVIQKTSNVSIFYFDLSSVLCLFKFWKTSWIFFCKFSVPESMWDLTLFITIATNFIILLLFIQLLLNNWICCISFLQWNVFVWNFILTSIWVEKLLTYLQDINHSMPCNT